jgi:hypothetical protein
MTLAAIANFQTVDPGEEILDSHIDQFANHLNEDSRHNYVTNGDFQVSQRGSYSTSDNGHIIDRWRLLLGAVNAATASQESSDVPAGGSRYALKLTSGSASHKFGALHVIESRDCWSLRGETVSLQAKLKCTAGISDVKMGVLVWTSTGDSTTGDPVSAWGTTGSSVTPASNWAFANTPSNLSVTTSWDTYFVPNVTIPTNAVNLAIMIWSDDTTATTTTDYLLMTDVQLERGTVCTDFDRRSYPETLLKCKRFYQVIGIGPAGFSIGSGSAVTAIIQSGLFVPEMRTAPAAITVIDQTITYVEWGIGSGTTSSSSISTSYLDAKGFTVQISGFSATVNPRSPVSLTQNWGEADVSI